MPAADIIIVNASLWSGTRRREADAICLGGTRVLATGRAGELAQLADGATRRIDARGATVTPGLTDSHIHLLAWARAQAAVDLSGCASRDEAVARARSFAAQHPRLPIIVGRGWDSETWSDVPDRASLDAVLDDRPVLLHSRDFHNLWVNGAALRAAGIDHHRGDPPGGRIERDSAGEPSGLLRENATRLCEALERQADASDLEQVRSAVERLHAWGVTAVHDFEGPEAHRVLRAMVRGPHPKVRVLMHVRHTELEPALATGMESGLGDDWFRLGAVKLFADGTLGSRTAAMLAPYDGTDERGSELIPADQLERIVASAVEGGWSVAVHAIGDRACRSALDAFAAVRARIPGLALPPRVEHAQLVEASDVPRFAALRVAASMQPVHCTSDIERAERYWGSRKAGAYPWRSLLDAGALLAFGSDAPVEVPSPAFGLHAAVTRERPGRCDPFVPEQRLDLDEALRAYVTGPPRLSGTWPRLGTLEPGATADLVVWNSDLHRLAPGELRDAHPVVTIVDGRIVYEREASASPALGDPSPAVAR